MKHVVYPLMAFLAIGHSSPAQDLPTSLGALPASENLPDLFTFDDGTAVENRDDWKRRRQELIAPLMYYQYGRIPPRPDQVTSRLDKQTEHKSGLGTVNWLTLIIDSAKQLQMRIVIYHPKTAGPHPVVIEEEGNLGGSKNAAMFMAKNYLLVEYARHDLDPGKNDFIGPAQAAYAEYDWAT